MKIEQAIAIIKDLYSETLAGMGRSEQVEIAINSFEELSIALNGKTATSNKINSKDELSQDLIHRQELYTEYNDLVDLENSPLGEKNNFEYAKFLVLQRIKLNSERIIEYLLKINE